MKKILFFISLLIFANSMANAAPSSLNKEVRNFVDKLGNDIISTASNKKFSDKARNDKIIDIIDASIDSNWISRFVLGKYYRTFSDAQKSEFQELYRQFMINTYAPKFKNYNGRKFTVLSVEKQRIFYVARCEFLPRDSNVPISFDFRVKDKNGELVVIDFVAEGVSLIESQRSEFDSTISQKGNEPFLKTLRTRVAELKKQNS